MTIPEYPISRIEHYLARANGQNVTPPDPISRIEHYLAGIAGGVPQELLDDVADLKSQLETKAEIDGYYQDMTVGDAEQMISTQYVEDTEPYLYRTTGGTSDVGNREYVRAITGGTVAWNQLAPESIKAFTSTTTDTKAYFTCYLSQVESPYRRIYENQDQAVGVVEKILNPTFSGNIQMIHKGSSRNIFCIPNNVLSVIFGHKYFWRVKFTGTDPTTEGGISYEDFMLFDLTAMFGSAIADYIYSLEQTTAGAGVSFFRKLFPLDYYPYDAGTLKNVEGLTAHEMVGFNQWNEEWEVGGYNYTTGAVTAETDRIRSKNFSKCLPSTQYYWNIPGKNLRILYYDANKEFITFDGWYETPRIVTTPPNAYFFKIGGSSAYGTTYKHDICINLSWSGTRNGEYEPYVKHTYALDDSLTLRGIPKLSDDGKLMYDGDRYLPDGTVERKYGVVDLGTLTWTYRTDTAMPIFSTRIDNAKPVTGGNAVGSIICPKYTVATLNNVSQSGYDKTIAKAANVGYVYVQDSTYTDAAIFKAAMSGVLLVYELATPTTETATPYPEVQLCDDWGTERFVTDSIVPVGTETDYPANLRDKLQHLPDLASSDGYYAIKQVGTQMTLEPFRIPKAPTTDGTYTLRATVSGGVPTYTWEQEVIVNASEEA